jgi:hypothetical protein
MSEELHALLQRAQAVLDRNWLGHATKPAPHLYPHQWSWDSAFIAIGYSHYDQDRAEQELRSLFRAQWANGMLPHIVFNPAVVDYYPGPGFWQTGLSPHAPASPRTSAIVQPPAHATAVWHAYKHAQDAKGAEAFLAEMFPKLLAWHTFLYEERDVDKDGLVFIRHPWESGQDNSPIWDRVLARFELTPEMVPEYQRIDTSVVESSERPSKEEYDRYAYLVKLARDHNHDEKRIREASPFLVQDVLFNTLLVRANHDLAAIARVIGEAPDPFEAWAERTKQGMNDKLWDGDHAIYFDYDLVSGEQIHAHVAAGFSPLFAAIPDLQMAESMLDNLNSRGFCRLNDACWAVPSYDKEAPGFSPNRYWRGPIWININWTLYHGLRRYGFDEYAERVKQAICQLPQQSGFHEYFDPDSGEGHGSPDFSWTAALVIDLLLEEGQLEEA